MLPTPSMSDVYDKNYVLHPNINDAYSILGLKQGASQEDVKQAYRKLAKIWHPDRFPNQQQKQEAEEKIKIINLAYEQLKFIQPSAANQSFQTNPTKIHSSHQAVASQE